MSETLTTSSAAHEPRRATRDTENSIFGGVSAGLAQHLGVPVLWVRVAFIALATLSGLGIMLYGGLWATLPSRERFEASTPGAESADRSGRRARPIRRLADAGPAVAVGAFGVGVLLVLKAVLGLGHVFWPLLLAGLGIVLVWRQLDEVQRERWLDRAEGMDPFRMLVGDGWQSWARLAGGLALLGIGAVSVAWADGTLIGVLGALGLIIGALALVVGPLVLRLARDLGAERDERIRTQERADVAAHLHDSVLQTLALIQKNAGDAGAVAKLARAQERGLRSWLYDDLDPGADTVAAALRQAADEVDDTHGVAVDVVVVGDAPLDDAMRPLVAASREAMVNAAKHAQVSQVSVFAEVTTDAVEVFVRDRGVGFDPSTVADDRHGVSGSIVGRMERHGGTATVSSVPGDGTNVTLRMPRSAVDEEGQHE